MSLAFNKLVLVVFLCLSFLQTARSLACTGGVCGGGGNDLEEGFKMTILHHIASLQNLVGDAAARLNFSPDEIALALNASDQIKPLCAPKDKIDILIKLGKKAFVFKNEPNIIYMDCKTVSEESWNRLFRSELPKDIGFFIHEAFRVMQKEGEDDYHFSSSIYGAFRRENELIEPIIAKLFYDQVGSCHAFANMDWNKKTALIIQKDRKKIFAKYIRVEVAGEMISPNPDGVMSQILTGDGYPSFIQSEQDINKRMIYHLLEVFGCLENK